MLPHVLLLAFACFLVGHRKLDGAVATTVKPEGAFANQLRVIYLYNVGLLSQTGENTKPWEVELGQHHILRAIEAFAKLAQIVMNSLQTRVREPRKVLLHGLRRRIRGWGRSGVAFFDLLQESHA